LKALLEEKDKFGFIIVDGNGALFGTLQGSRKTVLERFTVDLPRKHGRGGQSQNRFARIRTESRHNYVREVCEAATDNFITNDMPNVRGLILAGSADLKTEVVKSDLFDQRLLPTVLKVIDISYGGENGFAQAINLSEDMLQMVRYVHEKKVVEKFFEEIARDSEKFVFGIKDTIDCLFNGSIDVLIIYEDIAYNYVKMINSKEQEVFEFLPTESIGFKSSKYINPRGEVFQIVENIPLTGWLIDNHNRYVGSLELVTNQSPEGYQFVKGFGGIGGILRYKMQTNFDNDNICDTETLDDFI